MANYDATSGSYTTRLTVTETGTDTATNTSTVNFSLTLIKNSGTGLWNNDSCSWSININGTSYSGSFTYDFRSYSSLTLKGSTNQTITHNGDGTKSISVSASVNMDNTPYVYTMSPSGTLTLTTIPRASDIALGVSSFSITSASGNAFTWTITAKSNSFYNRLRYSIGNKSNVSSNKGQGSSSGYFTNQELLSALPTSTSGSLTVYCDTYSDSGYSNLIGTKSVVITVSVNTSYIKPSVSLGNIGINSSPISGYAVAGYSSLKDTFSTTNSYGASSVTTYFSISTGSLQTTSTSSTSGTIYTNTVPQSNSNYTITIYAQAKDSRGATSSTVSKSITVYGYTPPTATLNAYRVASSSSTTEDGAGTYAYVTFSGAVSASVNGQNSVQVISCSYWGSISGQATNGGHYALADTQTVTFQLTVTDKVTSSTATKTISTASYPLDLYDDGSGHVGVGLGSIAKYSGCLTTPLIFTGPDANHKELICDVSKAEIVAQDTTLTTSSTDDAWFTALLKAICVKYPSQQNVLFKGDVAPNSLAHYEVMIYNTSSLSSSGLPLWSRGNYSKQSLLFYMFGTDNGTFFRELVDAKSLSSRSISTKIISDTSINTLNTATFLTWLNNNNLNFNENGTTIVTADARYQGYATAIINKVSHNYGRAIMISFYNSLMVARLNNGSWIEGEYVHSIQQDSYNGSREIFINSGVPFTIELQTYGGAILKGFCQGIGGVLIGLMKQGSTIYARDLMSGQNWGNSYLTFTLNNNVLTIATPLTASNSRFTFEYTCN